MANSYLANFKSVSIKDGGDGIITHTSIGGEGFFGGSFNLPEENWEDFMTNYWNKVFVGKVDASLVERWSTDGGALAIDLDFRYAKDITLRQFGVDDITEWIHDIIGEICSVSVIPEGAELPIWVLQKKSVNTTSEENANKDGLHIIAGIHFTTEQQQHLRELVLKKWEISNPFPWNTNPLKDVYDATIANRTNGFTMVGSKKPKNEAYKRKYVYHFKMDDGSWDDISYTLKQTSITFEEFKKMSLQYKHHAKYEVLPPTIEILEKIKHNAKKSNNIKITKTNSAHLIPNVSTSSMVKETREKYTASFLQETSALLDIIPKDLWNNYPTWIKLVWAVGTTFNNYDKAREVCLKYSSVCDKWDENRDIPVLEKLLKENNGGLTYNSLKYFAKKHNPHAYKDWLVIYKKYLKISILNKGENDVAKFIETPLKEILVYTNERWWKFEKTTGLWRLIKKPTSTIVDLIQSYIDEAKETLLSVKNAKEDITDVEKDKFAHIEKMYSDERRCCSCGSYSSQVLTLLTEKLYRKDFEEKLDIHPYKIAYKNGILNLQTLIFSEGIVADDFLTNTLHYDYQVGKKEDIAEVREQLKKICNYNEEDLEYYLSSLGYALTGDAKREQFFWNLRGQKASNGKTIPLEAIGENLPIYFKKAENDIFEEKYGSIHKEVAEWRGKRILLMNEMSSKKQNENLIKELSDGNPIPYKVMYGTTAMMPITFKMFFVGNKTLTLTADGGIVRRWKMVQLDSDFQEHFTEDNYETREFVKNKNFGDDLSGKYRNAFNSLLFKYSKKYADEQQLVEVPADWLKQAKEATTDNNKFQSFFENNFEVGEGFFISTARLTFIISQNKGISGSTKDIKDELKAMRIKFEYKSQDKGDKGNGEGYQKGWWYGFKPIEESIN